ncbi:MAG TPA: CHASE2 domain-containing protein [Rhodanobacter sp.]
MAWMAGIGVLVLLLASGATRRWDNALYDLHLRHWSYPPDSDVIIVAIDPKSLDELGRWPWPRSVHAKLIDRLHAAGVQVIGMDVVLSSDDTGHPEQDQLLGESMHRAGNVVLPVFAESVDLGGQLQESLPVTTILRQAAGIGHVDTAKDEDDMVRGAYLKAGLGRPYWPALALAVYDFGRPASNKPLPGLRNPDPDDASPYLWMRDDYVLLRYAGPAGSFGRVSYVDVLDGTTPAELLKGRSVFIGATAEGLGDMIRTPPSIMPGVEYQANILESLRRGMLITPLGFLGQLALGSGTLALPLLLFGLRGFRSMWRSAVVATLSAIVLSIFLLRTCQLWWPPSACLLIIGTVLACRMLFVVRQRFLRMQGT